MLTLLRKFRSGVRFYGAGTVLFQILPHLFWRKVRTLLGAHHFSDEIDLERDHAEGFDRTYGTDTSTIVPLSELGFPNPDEGIRYEPTLVSVLNLGIDLPIDHRQFVFIDLGSGKGRTLLVASRKFKRVIGVEYSQKLVEIAEQNSALFRQREMVAPIELVRGDIKDFAFPQEDQVVFLYESLWGDPMVECVDRLIRTVDQSGKRCWLVWVTRIPMVPLAMRKSRLKLHALRVDQQQSWYVYQFCYFGRKDS